MLLDWSASTDQAQLTLKSLIIFHGPGSWKCEARWDEYVVQIHNLGQTSVRIESAELVDVLGQGNFTESISGSWRTRAAPTGRNTANPV